MTSRAAMPDLSSDDWGAQAACLDHDDPDLWFVAESNAAIEEAIAICAGCPVQVECRDYAMANPSLRDGVWGGLSPRQRQRVRRGRPPGPTAAMYRRQQEAPCGTKAARERHHRRGEAYDCRVCWPDPRELRPCGTHAAFVRHRLRGEEPCEACVEGERGYQRERYLRRRDGVREDVA